MKLPVLAVFAAAAAAVLAAAAPASVVVPGSGVVPEVVVAQGVGVVAESGRAAPALTGKTDAHVDGVNIPDGRVGGETLETAVIIPAVPFMDTGNTCGLVDDYDEMCPYGSVSPDCVYSFTPTEDMFIDINLCMSEYDTKVYVYENEHTPGVPIACNDDNFACTPPVFLWQSWLTDVELHAGHTYFVVIDGYGGDCGDYVMDIMNSPSCIVPCPSDALLEGEVDCYDGYVDDYNGGCGSTPLVFTAIDCSNETIALCGTGGVFDFNGLTYRDTDWYMLTLDAPATVTAGIISEFNPLMGFVDFSGGCANVEFYDYVTPWKCEYAEVSYDLPAGQTVLFVAPALWDTSYECGSVYYLTVDGYECTSPVEERSWGSIKALYR